MIYAMRIATRVGLGLAVTVVIGLIGASAFNADHGFVVQSHLLWQVFGVMFEIGLPLLFVGFVLVAVAATVQGLRSRSL